MIRASSEAPKRVRRQRRALCGLAAVILSVPLVSQTAAGPLEDAKAASDRGDYARAVDLLRPLAARGDPEAEESLGEFYFLGLGVKRDVGNALLLARRALASGSKSSASLMLMICGLGQSATEQDCASVAEHYKTVALAGDVNAALALSGLYARGAPGVPRDATSAVQWLRKAADTGSPTAEMLLATWYEIGAEGLPHDPAQALAWLQRAADQGDPSAMGALAMRYQFGLNVPKDPAKAIALYRKAAQGGDLPAIDMLARLYSEGKEVPRDDAEAFHWYLQAARQGDAQAQAKVGSAYATGKGATRDPVLAYAWLSIAVATAKDGSTENLDDVALARDGAAAGLTSAQKARAKRLIHAQLAAQSADPAPGSQAPLTTLKP